MKNSIEFYQEELKRVSEWIRFADQKVAFLAVYYSTLFGFIITNKDVAIQKMVLFDSCTLSIALLIVLFGIMSFSFGITSVIFTVFPRLKNGLTNESLFYYGTISNMKFIDFKKKLTSLSEEEAKEQIIEQIYTNSVIADQKMKGVKNGTICLLIFSFSVVIYVLV